MNRTLASFLSVIGHPLLIVTYALLIMLIFNPFAFGARSLTDQSAMVLLIMVFATTFVIPGAGVAIMKPLGLIKSIQMEDKQDRTGPYIITGVFYLWLFKNLLSGSHAPEFLAQFVLGATIGLFLSFFINIFTKISAHAVGMGGLLAGLFLIGKEWGGASANLSLMGGTLFISLNAVYIGVLFFAGLIGVARLALGAHTPDDLYRGYAVGIFTQIVASWFM
jgi:membrane-associated phospholipid phosphatase